MQIGHCHSNSDQLFAKILAACGADPDGAAVSVGVCLLAGDRAIPDHLGEGVARGNTAGKILTIGGFAGLPDFRRIYAQRPPTCVAKSERITVDHPG